MFQPKDLFYTKLEEHYSQQPNKKPYTGKQQSEIIKEILQGKISKGSKTRREYYLLSTYDVLSVGNENYLIKKVKNEGGGDSQQIKYVVAYEDLFDKLNECHIKTGHGGSLKMQQDLKNMYCIPRPAINAYLKICQPCSEKKSNYNRKIAVPPPITKEFNERGQVDLIDYQSSPDGKYKWVLKYQDHTTKFLILRPLESNQTTEIAGALLKIFLTFGAPQILQSDVGREFVSQIIKELKSMWPECIIVNGRPRHPQSQDSVESSNQDIESMLQAWMTDNNSEKWSVGIHFVQWQKNTSHHRNLGLSPYRALFGADANIGITSSNLPKNVLEKLINEEDMEEIINSRDELSQEDQEIEIANSDLTEGETEDAAGPSGDEEMQDLNSILQLWKQDETNEMTAEDCKKRLQIIRDMYKGRKKNEKKIKSNHKNNKIWGLQEHMWFLDNNTKEKRSVPNIMIPELKMDEPNIENGDEMYDASSISTRADEDHERSEKPRIINNINNYNREDEIDLFFRSMALTVKKFPPALIAQTKLKVCNIVSEMELIALQNQKSETVVTSLSDS